MESQSFLHVSSSKSKHSRPLNTDRGNVKCIQDWLCNECYGPTRRQKPNGLRIWFHLQQWQNRVGLSFYPSHLAQRTSKLKSHAGISCRSDFFYYFCEIPGERMLKHCICYISKPPGYVLLQLLTLHHDNWNSIA